MKKVSESLKKGVESFLEFSPEVSAHMENTENPHAVTKEQVGLGNLKNEEQATKAEFDLHRENLENPHAVTKSQVGLGNVKNLEQATKAEFQAHAENQENPHGVTKEQVGLENVKNEEQATKMEFLEEQARVTAHLENTKNPHFVTKEQIGLGKVKNEEQVSVPRYMEHVGGITDKHSGADIMYSDTKSVNEKIDELLVESGSGTMYHDELLNRDNENQHPISAITGLRSELDTLSANFSGISHATLSGKDLPSQHPISAIEGLSEKLDEVLVFEGVTTNDAQTELFSAMESEFIHSSGRFCVPWQTMASIELEIMCVQVTDGRVTQDENNRENAYLFTSKGMIYPLNDGFRYCMSEMTAQKYGTEVLYSASFRLGSFDVSDDDMLRVGVLQVKGAAGHKVYWRAVMKISNIIRIGADE